MVCQYGNEIAKPVLNTESIKLIFLILCTQGLGKYTVNMPTFTGQKVGMSKYNFCTKVKIFFYCGVHPSQT